MFVRALFTARSSKAGTDWGLNEYLLSELLSKSLDFIYKALKIMLNKGITNTLT